MPQIPFRFVTYFAGVAEDDANYQAEDFFFAYLYEYGYDPADYDDYGDEYGDDYGYDEYGDD